MEGEGGVWREREKCGGRGRSIERKGYGTSNPDSNLNLPKCKPAI